MKRYSVLVAIAFIINSVSSEILPYKNPALSPAERTADLLDRMTVEEKVGQLICPLGWPMYEKISDDSVTVSDAYRKFIGQQNGGMLWATFRADPWTRKTLETGLNPQLSAEAYNELQKYAIENSRLGIPIILAEEAPHGHMAIGTTVFPTGIGLASTWSKETLENVGRVVAKELRAQGAHIGYGPVIDLAREPRWSRVEETYGEDVFLTSEMAKSMLKGTTIKNNGPENGIISTLKHFIAYGIPEGGHNGNPSVVGKRDLMENFFPAFENAVNDGAMSVMTSYNAIDGIPSTANDEYLKKILRDDWGFEGFVVSDLESIDGLCFTHHIAANRKEAAEIAMNAGVDVDLGAHCYPLLVESVEEGKVDESRLNEAAGRVLKLKFELGLFDNPYVEVDNVAGNVRTSENKEVAHQAALQSLTLLKNRDILPLKKDIKVAVIGPNADNMYNQLGDYTAPQDEENIVTPLEGIKSLIGDENVVYVKGCVIRDESVDEIEQAVEAAKGADVAIVVVGGSSARDFKTKYIDTGAAVVDETSISDMEAGEGFDRATLTLLGNQNRLLQAVKDTGTPLIVVYIEGRPLDKVWAEENADAVITQWYPGQAGGTALAEVLFGDYNPSGRLPVSVPRSVGQLPVYYNKPIPRGHDYVEMSSEPLYEFGYGLSYTSYDYSNLRVEPEGDSVKVSFDIKNSGEFDGEEVPQIYVIDQLASTVRPRKQLRAFDRVAIAKGETKHIEFVLPPESFMLYNRNMEKVLEPGTFTVEVGASSKDIRLSAPVTLN